MTRLGYALIGLILLIIGSIGFAAMHGITAPAVSTVYCQRDGNLGPTKAVLPKSDHIYCLERYNPGTHYDIDAPASLSFSIIDDQGTKIKNFTTTQEQIMHVFIVRKDLNFFQHVHPHYDTATGVFTLSDITFSEPGPYRILAEFSPDILPHNTHDHMNSTTAYTDIMVGNQTAYEPEQLSQDANANTTSLKTYQVDFELEPPSLHAGESSTLSYTIKKKKKLVTDLELYLGTLGHITIFKESSLDFVHAHTTESTTDDQTGTVHVATSFPSAGIYKIFAEFKHAESIITATNVVTIPQGTTDTTTPDHHSHQ